MRESKTNALILAAGFSSRMGTPKHLLQLSEGQTFLKAIIDQYLMFGCEKIVVVLNAHGIRSVEQTFSNQYPGVKLVENPAPEAGRFLSIKLGLKVLANDSPVFMQNVDNPFAPKKVLKKLRSNLESFDFVKPVYENEGGHPVLLGPKIISAILEQPFADLNFKIFLAGFNGTMVEVEDGSILININTPEDYERLLPNRF